MRGREGVGKIAVWGNFQGLTGATAGGGRVVKNRDEVVYGWSLNGAYFFAEARIGGEG